MKNFSILSRFLCAAAVAAALTSCGKSASEPKSAETPNIVYIGLDGWGAYSLPKADMPTVKSLMEQGSYTLQKRTVLPSSSAVNWASMFMGAGPELHGYTQWGSQTPELPSRVILKNGIFPTIFQLYRDANPDAEIGMIYEWEGMKYVADTLSLSHYEQADEAQLTNIATEYIKTKKPSLVAVVYANPDYVGHSAGHDTPEYYEKLKDIDGYIAEIVKAVDEAGMTDNTVFIVTSDHGGVGTGHGGITMAEMETPFIIAGKGIKKGGEFQESMMQYDVASTMAKILGVEQPQVWIGRPMDQVFE